MAVAINAADRSLRFVIRFLHWIRKGQQLVAFVRLTWDHNSPTPLNYILEPAARDISFVRMASKANSEF
jgi:hypothetical protein